MQIFQTDFSTFNSKIMKTVKIQILRDDVVADAARTSAFAAGRAADPDAVDRIAADEGALEMLNLFWTEAAAVVAARLRDFIVSVDYALGSFAMVLSLSSAYDDAQSNSLSRDIYSSMVASVTAQWYAMANKPDAPAMQAKADALLEAAAARCTHRLRPQRRLAPRSSALTGL